MVGFLEVGVQHEMKLCELPGDEFQLDARLVEVGESITFALAGATSDDLFEIFPRYLECCDPEQARQSLAPLRWLDALEREVLPLGDSIRYTPQEPGNYLARWTSGRYGVEYRYFAVIDQSYVVYRPAIWSYPTPFPATGGPEIHNGGLPLDWCIDSDRTDAPYIPRLLDEQQRYGGGVVYGMTASCDEGQRADVVNHLRSTVADFREHGLDIRRVANLWYGDRLSNDRVHAARSAGFDVIDGYVPRAHTCGLGAPLFPFYIGSTDYRFPSQDGPADAVACVFDFVGSWHFHGPVGFHRPSAEGSWERARYYIDLAAQEAVLVARNSGTHNFLTTLVNFESPIGWGDSAYDVVWDDERGQSFFAEYMHLLAFEHARRWPIVFARAADYADYFRAHHALMPRRIVSSITHDLEYDKFWTDEWHEQRIKPTGYVPVNQSLRAFRQSRAMPQYNMPMSLEFINYNDNRRTCRFEYACPKPVHYYDLTGSTPWPPHPPEVDLPDPDVTMSVLSTSDHYEITYVLAVDSSFPDYLMAIWDIPREHHEWRVETNAEEFMWVENTDGNCRGIVRFNLTPECTITVRWHR
jgi:hypothetical protein